MTKKNPEVDQFIADGCGRCPLGGTPQCKVHSWTKEVKKLRTILLDCGLTEERKWGVPCYTHEESNIAVIGVLKDCCTLGFFKGALLLDALALLDKPGENTQSARLFRFTSVQSIVLIESVIKDYILEAIEVEKKGLKVDFKAKSELVLPIELEQRFDTLPALRTAFFALTPGRQRGYILFFNAAKQSKTRLTRIEKCIPQILEGRGMHD